MLLSPVPAERRGSKCKVGPHWDLGRVGALYFNLLSEQVNLHCTYANLPLSCASVLHLRTLHLCIHKTTFKVRFLNDKCSTGADQLFSVTLNDTI